GTGPKAGGPLYLTKLVASPKTGPIPAGTAENPALATYIGWLETQSDTGAAAAAVKEIARASRLGQEIELPGPVGERNLYALHPRGRVALSARTATGLRIQFGAVLATGNSAVISTKAGADMLAGLPRSVTARIIHADEPMTHDGIAAALVEGNAEDVLLAFRLLAERSGAIVPLQSATPEALAGGDGYMLDWLLEEVSTSINTTAAGGNASLMAVA
ncbi:MAG: trifunctional transcriptional regulator/proline dehydrogenase/L-glutamate gamma-semialdehyde dehydrogenase, partial [Novosphingobium sp.]